MENNGVSFSNDFVLYQNYPNPFNPTSILEFEISENGPPRRIVSLKVYNALGMEVADLVNEKKSAGRYSVSFDGSNLPSGVYFYKLSVTGGGRDFTETKRMVLLK
ncbi:MAG: T9SS type A sorting domain-containing protein [Ignavibacteria bacterium]